VSETACNIGFKRKKCLALDVQKLLFIINFLHYS